MKEYQIPEMTDPLGRAWKQPNKSEVKFLLGVAWVSKETFEKFAEYSSSTPSGVYSGKMWKRVYHVRQNNKLVSKDLLCWYQDSNTPNHCMIMQVDLMIEK